MNSIANERRRLLATLLNTLAAGSVVTGVFAPAAANFYGLNPAAPYHWWLVGPVWLLVAGGLHPAAQLILGRLLPWQESGFITCFRRWPWLLSRGLRPGF